MGVRQVVLYTGSDCVCCQSAGVQSSWVSDRLYCTLEVTVCAVSLQEFSRAELTSRHGAVRQQVEDERRRREEMLNMRQTLAEQVSQRSQQLHNSNNTGETVSQHGESFSQHS